jgi:uncharacterized protein YgbK (DUF1537 family)
MTASDNKEVKVLKHTDEMPEEGIVIGEAVSNEDIAAWAQKADKTWVLAGAGDFLIALFMKRYTEKMSPVTNLQLPHLYVSGTAFEKSVSFISAADRKFKCVAYLSQYTMETGVVEYTWVQRAYDILKTQKRAIVAIDPALEKQLNIPALDLRLAMAKAVKKIVDRIEIKELLIEGGSTSSAILQEMSIIKLPLVNEITRGVVRTKVKDQYITVKPGSYALPPQIIQLYN